LSVFCTDRRIKCIISFLYHFLLHFCGWIGWIGSTGAKLLSAWLVFAGLFLVSLGHRYYKCQLFLFGFLVSAVLFYVILSLFITVGDTGKIPKRGNNAYIYYHSGDDGAWGKRNRQLSYYPLVWLFVAFTDNWRYG
jgi:hypothetical protein